MSRVKRGKNRNKKRKKVLKKAKGYRHGRKSKKRQAKEAVIRAGKYAFAHRRKKKNEFRKEWQIKINAAAREEGLSYSKFIHLLKQNDIGLNRKVLADIAENEPEAFKKIVEEVK